jgi:hypothetical protein
LSCTGLDGFKLPASASSAPSADWRHVGESYYTAHIVIGSPAELTARHVSAQRDQEHAARGD